jgi:hypothetical protein
MNTYCSKRFGKRWTISECIELQREFELLELSIDEIAEKHQRTPGAIISRLDYEGFADYNVLYSNYYNLNSIIHNSNYTSQEEQYAQGDDDEVEEQDDDNSSDYQDESYASDSDDEDEDEDEAESLKTQVMRLEKQVNMLTEMIIKNNSNKNVFSFFS